MIPGGNTSQSVQVVSGGATSIFDWVSGSYVEEQGGTDTLVDNTSTHQFTLTDSSGTQTTFYDFSSSVAANLQGTFISNVQPGSGGAAVESTNDAGQPTSILLTDAAGDDQELWSLTYTTGTGPDSGRLSTITQQQKVPGTWTTFRVATYVYYESGDANGNAGDLESETITDGSDNVLQSEYWRYYTPGESGGSPDEVKYAFGSDSTARLAAAFPDTDFDTLTDEQVAPYADQFFAYDSEGRVTTRTVQGQGCSSCSGGLGTFTFSYSQSDNTPGYNSWTFKQVENDARWHGADYLQQHLRPDDTQRYGGSFDQPAMGHVSMPTTATATQIMEAQPSAVNLPDSLSTLEAYPDLLNQTGTSGSGVPEYEYLNNSSGEIDLTDYYATTTATSSTPGGAAGYEEDTKIVQGQEGTPILQTSTDYYAITGGSSTIYPTADFTQYRNTDGTGAETTSYSYTFFSGTVQMQSMTTSLPVVDAAQNGADTAATSTDVYDANGNVIWSMDANGFITYNQYDPTTQALIKTIQDVNTDDTSDFDAGTLPSGWTTPSGGGLELITTYEVDQLGRTTEETSPNGNVTYTVYNDAESDDGFVDEVRTYPGWHYDSTLGEYTTTGPGAGLALQRSREL